MNDEIKTGWDTRFVLWKFRDCDGQVEAASKAGLPMEDIVRQFEDRHLCTEEWHQNVALNEGLGAIIDLITGISSPTKWDNSNARVEVGNGTASATPSQTGLQGASKAYATMDTGYPQKDGQTAKWRGTFGSGSAEFAWEEYSVCNSGDDSTGINLNRKVESKGTKGSGETWTLEIQVTLS